MQEHSTISNYSDCITDCLGLICNIQISTVAYNRFESCISQPCVQLDPKFYLKDRHWPNPKSLLKRLTHLLRPWPWDPDLPLSSLRQKTGLSYKRCQARRGTWGSLQKKEQNVPGTWFHFDLIFKQKKSLNHIPEIWFQCTNIASLFTFHIKKSAVYCK